jgi:hypothetical protein
MEPSKYIDLFPFLAFIIIKVCYLHGSFGIEQVL